MLETDLIEPGNELITMGFETGVAFFDDEPQFTLEDVMSSLARSDYGFPNTIPVDIGEKRAVHVIVDEIRPVWGMINPGDGYTRPDLYGEGSIEGRTQRVRICIIFAAYRGRGNVAYVRSQLISGPPPMNEVVYHYTTD
jgi:hypothetical protein